MHCVSWLRLLAALQSPQEIFGGWKRNFYGLGSRPFAEKAEENLRQLEKAHQGSPNQGASASKVLRRQLSLYTPSLPTNAPDCFYVPFFVLPVNRFSNNLFLWNTLMVTVSTKKGEVAKPPFSHMSILEGQLLYFAHTFLRFLCLCCNFFIIFQI